MKMSIQAGVGTVLVLHLAVALPAGSQAPSTNKSESSSAVSHFQSEEYVLFGNVNTAGGEAEITVDPKNPNNIFVGILAGNNRLADGKLPDGKPATRSQRLGEHDWSYCILATTHNRGATWAFSDDDLRKKFGLSNCFDPFVEASNDGTLYWGALPEVSRDGSDYKAKGEIAAGGPVAMRGGSYIMSSMDQGKTWSEPVEMMGSDTMARWPNGKDMVWELSSPWDRAVVVIDSVTGTLYTTGHGRGGNPAHEEDSVTASHDKGRTWGQIFQWDSHTADYPQSGRGDIAAAGGRLAVVYSASKTPDASSKCPCIVFETSKDDGKTFERHVLPNIDTTEGAPSLAADPTKPGHYAVMLMKGDEQLVVYRTEDYGKTWLTPVVAAQPEASDRLKMAGTLDRAMSAFKYSRNGDLGIVYRVFHPDKSFDIWSSVSRNGGKGFKNVRVSHASSPEKLRDRGHFLVGDDYFDLDFDQEFVHFVWCDSRPGFLATWYGRIPLSAYGEAASE